MKKYLPLLQYLPIWLFALTAAILGWTNSAWQNAFMIGGATGLATTALCLYHRIDFDRMALGINLFLLIGGISFLFMILPILYFYSAHKGAAFFGSILIIGIASTIGTKGRFIGSEHGSKKAILSASLKLIAIAFACLIFSILGEVYGIWISVLLPQAGLLFARRQLAQKLAH